MSDSIVFASTSADDIAMGAQVVTHTLQVLGSLTALAVGCAFSSAIVGAIVTFIGAIVMYYVACFAALPVVMCMKTAHVEAIGHGTNAAIFKLGGLFARARNAVTASKVAAA